MIPTLVAVVACLVLAVLSELARRGAARVLGATPKRRALAMFAGSLAIYVAIVVIAFVYFRTEGVATTQIEYVVQSVPDGYPASGKLEAGDRVIAFDGEPMYLSLSTLVDERNGAPVRLTFRRNGATHDVTLQPVGHDGHWVLGFRPLADHARTTDGALGRALGFPVTQLEQLVPPPASDRADPGGPKRIIDIQLASEPSFGVKASRQTLLLATLLLVLSLVTDVVRAIRTLRARA
ncbi:MAG TPA: hypothetical protein VFV99_07130 [Kofleriaceae bacterium]|nr:hypothetical protein [Kofleriaceae bacterium]